METILERVTMQQQIAEQEAQKHNAQIRERYKRLQDAEADQFAQSYTQESNATDYTVRASVLAPERPAVSVDETPVFEQTPHVTEFVREKIDTPVFTTEKFNAVQEQPTIQATTFAPVEIQPVQTQAPAAVEAEAQYSLTQFAKMVMAAFAAAVIVMLTLICVNTQLIRQKSVQLETLQAQNVQLKEEYAQLQSRIQAATSEETIAQYALSQGMIQP